MEIAILRADHARIVSGESGQDSFKADHVFETLGDPISIEKVVFEGVALTVLGGEAEDRRRLVAHPPP